MEKTFSFETLPQDVQQLSKKVDYLTTLLTSFNQASMPDQWLNLSELCEYHPDKPAKATVYAWVRTRSIPFHKRGKKLAFLKSEIDENIKSARVKTVLEIEQDSESFLKGKKGRRTQP